MPLIHQCAVRTLLILLVTLSIGVSSASAQEVGLGMIMDDASYESIPLAPVLMRGDYDRIPASYSLRKYAPYPGNQGRSATCVGWATGYAARTIVAAIENGWTDRDYITDHAYSPSFVYNSLKKRYAGSGPDPACSKGAFVADAMNLLKSDGVAPLTEFPFDCELEVRNEDLQVANDHRIVEFQRIFIINAVDKIKNVRKAVAEGKPVVIGMNVPTSFLNAFGKEHWEPSEEGEQAEGGHAMTVIGYDDNKFGGSFEVMNSWGQRWGKYGFIWIPYEHFARYVRYGFDIFVSDRPEPDGPDLAGSVSLLLASGDSMRTIFQNGEFSVDRPYESGTQFRILVTNNEPAYVYAVATDLTRKITRLIPKDDSFSALLTNRNSHIALPPGDDVIVMDDEPGIDYLGVLYSDRELEIDSLISEMHGLPGSLYERLTGALGDAVIPQNEIAIAEDGSIAFQAKSDGGFVVPMVVAIEHVAPVAVNDRTPPRISLLSPKPVVTGLRGLTVRKEISADLEILGTAYDLAGIDSVTVNGVSATIEPDGTTFRATLPNSDTLSVLHIYAIDHSGNEARERFTIASRKEDSLPPDITMLIPSVQQDALDEVQVMVDTLVVSGTVRDNGELVAVYVNGIKADLGVDGTFSVEVPIVDGSTELRIRAYDSAGNVTDETWHIADAELLATADGISAEEAFVRFDVFYATDRAPTGRTSPRSYYGGTPGDLSHGIVEVSIPRTHQIGELESPAWWRFEVTPDPERHITLQSLRPMDEATLLKKMREEMSHSAGKSAFVYVHGYNTAFDQAARRTAQMAYDLNFDGIAAMYSWPSDGTLLGYASDEIDVERSVKYLKYYLDLIVKESGAEHVHLLAHSMGNRALTKALVSIAQEQVEPVFTEVILAAPDIDAELFRNDIAPIIQRTADRVTLYASANDKALMMSEKINGGRRAGDSREGILVFDGIETVDVSDIDMELLGMGHSYFAQTEPVLEDIVQVVGMRLPPEQRELIPRIIEKLRYWTLRFE